MAFGKPKGLINSVPKSGTNLLHSVLARLPGLRFQQLTLNRNFRWHPLNLLLPGWGGSCLAGVSQPQRVKLAAMSWQLRRLAAGRFTSAHLPYDARVSRMMADRGIRVIFALRDPRDVVVSAVFHTVSRPSQFLHRTYLRLPDEPARMTAAMLGLPDAPAGAVRGIAEQLAMTAGWISDPSVLPVRFEDLIGPRGGGSEETQVACILAIARHLGIDLGEAQAAAVGRDMYGKGMTFRRGVAGGWREHFTPELKDAFKQAAGAHLVALGYESSTTW